MKKNRMMRLASILLVATLMSTCTISGTFAKYVTHGSATDKARVAKWGVEITTAGSLFSKTYIDSPESDTVLSTVVSSNEDKLVAPGTNSDGTFKFSLKGTPEVDTKVAIVITGTDGSTTVKDAIDVVLPADTYWDPTTAVADDKVTTMTDDYHPLKFTLIHNGATAINEGTMKNVEEYLEDLSKNYEANTVLDDVFGEFELTWKWDYGTAAVITDTTITPNIAATDVYDTILGNAADGIDVGGTGAGTISTNVSFNIEILAEQID